MTCDDSNLTTSLYFVDEAGDTALFNKRKKPLPLGENGASKFFMVGIAKLHNMDALSYQLEALRNDVLHDPGLQNVPSMSKTAKAFHAKDDHIAVKREVYRVLEQAEVDVYVAIRNKSVLIAQAQLLFEQSGKKITASVLYDDLISRLFKRLLHKADSNKIVFAKRTKTFTDESLAASIRKAQANCFKSWGIIPKDNNHITSAMPSEHIGLQVVDYYLWALQRLYERNEDYYYSKVADKFKLIMDLDDKRNKQYGEWYSKSNLLTLQSLSGSAG